MRLQLQRGGGGRDFDGGEHLLEDPLRGRRTRPGERSGGKGGRLFPAGPPPSAASSSAPLRSRRCRPRPAPTLSVPQTHAPPMPGPWPDGIDGLPAGAGKPCPAMETFFRNEPAATPHPCPAGQWLARAPGLPDNARRPRGGGRSQQEGRGPQGLDCGENQRLAVTDTLLFRFTPQGRRALVFHREDLAAGRADKHPLGPLLALDQNVKGVDQKIIVPLELL